MQTDTCFLYQSQYKTCKMYATQLFKNLQPITHILTLFFAWKQFFSFDKGMVLTNVPKIKLSERITIATSVFGQNFIEILNTRMMLPFNMTKSTKKDCFFLLSHTISPTKLFTIFWTKSKFRYKMHHIWIQQEGQEGRNFTLKWIEQKLFIWFWEVYLESVLVLILFLLDFQKLLCRKPNNKSLHVIFPIEFKCFAFVFFLS